MQVAIRSLAPIVEVAGNNHGFILRHMLIDAVGECLVLSSAFMLQQAQVHAQGVQANGAPRDLDDAVEDAAAGALEYRDIDIFPADKRVHA